MKKLIAATFISLLAAGSVSADQIQDYGHYNLADNVTTSSIDVNNLPATAAGTSSMVESDYSLNGPFDHQD